MIYIRADAKIPKLPLFCIHYQTRAQTRALLVKSLSENGFSGDKKVLEEALKRIPQMIEKSGVFVREERKGRKRKAPTPMVKRVLSKEKMPIG